MLGPSPDTRHPFNGEPHTVFLKNIITHPMIEVGDYTYFNDPEFAAEFEKRNVLYHYESGTGRLVIGRYCALATGTTFQMNGGNHPMDGFSTYPFSIFGNGWEEGFDPATFAQANRGDTIVGNDVWFGRDCHIMPGVTIGDGAIIGAKAVVAKDVPPYAIVVGNPGRIVRRRFDEATIAELLDIAWWNWPADKVKRNLDAIRGNKIELLREAI
ncbi:CatB-related O-acetyltransferase [Rhodobacteraceae bacterium RKSG542]|uniref:CatB-related O-acetyltransferase n=1 Tax=Pseudovibrio flavus TaxID=2529854 RepID=UPI0012BC2B30|nr:CatB-related O-acetyltransferase [Pseudovibrio flavus]MTI17153.1 CatB-related O-acetyltransferase [Pseudovibrio flavus]